MNISQLEIEDVIKLMKDHDLTEIKLRKGKMSIKISRQNAGVAPAPGAGTINPEAGTGTAGEKSHQRGDGTTAEKEGYKPVTSPLVGTFYRSPSPDKDPFVKEGDAVKTGDTLCIVEAMKSMNEIKAEFDGTVREICVENAQPVEYNQLLFKLQ